ncbi:MAG: SagB/ThcOx family dehydrogenase [Bacteroidales bacterium]|jgi:SagB-type dehydrogenase family enzyme|nr:SagB/ThcOx family dehydrogenase [Bacteroidales bacterium]
MRKFLFLILILITSSIALQAQNIKLPEPKKTGGKPFYETINGRQSEREFVKKEMTKQMISNLLWVSNGFNRPDKRTAPTGMNRQEMELYVMFDNCVYFYNAKENVLEEIVKGDFIETLGQPNINKNAAITIIMVADLDKSGIESARISTGYISQNIYLFASAEDLGTVARGSFKKEELSKVLKLKEKQEVILVQPVGFLK